MAGVRNRGAALLLVLSAAIAASAPPTLHAVTDPCSATVTPGGLLTIPVLSFAGQSYEAGLQITGSSGDLIDAEIVVAQPTTRSCAHPAALVRDSTGSDTALVLYIPSLVSGNDDLGVELATVSTSGSTVTLRIAKAYSNKGLWTGTSTCRYSSLMFGGEISSRTDQTATVHAQFECLSPTPGFFGCIPSGGTGVWLPKAGYARFESHHQLTLGGASPGSTVTTDGTSDFSLPASNGDDFLAMTDNGNNTLGYEGIGQQTTPAFPHLQTVKFGSQVVSTKTIVTSDNMRWLGFVPGSTFPGTATTFSGSGDVPHVPVPGALQSSLTCTWSFVFTPPS